jgi:hypothetical protein
MTPTVSGTIKRRMFKAVAPARSNGPQCLLGRTAIPTGFLRFLPVLNNPWNLATARRTAAADGDNYVF